MFDNWMKNYKYLMLVMGRMDGSGIEAVILRNEYILDLIEKDGSLVIDLGLEQIDAVEKISSTKEVGSFTRFSVVDESLHTVNILTAKDFKKLFRYYEERGIGLGAAIFVELETEKLLVVSSNFEKVFFKRIKDKDGFSVIRFEIKKYKAEMATDMTQMLVASPIEGGINEN